MVGVRALTQFKREVSFFAARGPAHTMAYGRWRVKRWVQGRASRSFDVDTRALLAAFRIEGVTGEADQRAALGKLAEHLKSRSQPVFFFERRDRAKIASLVSEEEKQRTILAADRVCDNVFELRGAPPQHFQGEIDWTWSPNGNVDWRWDLNRHAFFEMLGRAYAYTGDERYAYKFKDLLLHWQSHNPARTGQLNWNSVFEVAFRINVWAWSLYYFRDARALDEETLGRLMAGLLAHGRYLDANIELHVPNNHLLLEAKALALVGILFPECRESARWQTRGLKILYREVRSQVCAEGVHGERATLYQRVIAGELLELFVLMENNGLAIPADVKNRFARMVEFERALARPDGTFPLLGDSAAEDTHLRFSASSGGPVYLKQDIATALQESDVWLLGMKRLDARRQRPIEATDLKSAAFQEGGYIIMRAGKGRDASLLTFDCGPFGYGPMPNHGHADALSVELYARGETLLVDPGMYSTALGDDWRDFFRGTRGHNTVVVDELDQSVLLDARRVYRPARATCLNWITNEAFDFADGQHDGYTRLSEPITHRRQVLFAKPDYWVIVDVLTGRGRHCFDLYWHMMPGAQTELDQESGALHVSNENGAALAIVPFPGAAGLRAEIITGATKPIQGWVSFRSGEKQAAPVLRYRQEALAPVQFCTVLYPYRRGEAAPVKISPLPLEGQGGADPALTALCIETPSRLDYVVIDRGIAARRKVFAGQEVNGPLAFISRGKEK